MTADELPPPVAWLVTLEDSQYAVTDEHDAQLVDDCTNAGAEVEPLYTRAALDAVMAQERERCEADAARMRWLLSGNGYFMEEEMLCGHGPCDPTEQDEARRRIDEQMRQDQG
jgi:hypothetical protein